MIDDAKLIWFKPSSELTCAARSIRHARQYGCGLERNRPYFFRTSAFLFIAPLVRAEPGLSGESVNSLGDASSRYGFHQAMKGSFDLRGVGNEAGVRPAICHSSQFRRSRAALVRRFRIFRPVFEGLGAARRGFGAARNGFAVRF